MKTRTVCLLISGLLGLVLTIPAQANASPDDASGSSDQCWILQGVVGQQAAIDGLCRATFELSLEATCDPGCVVRIEGTTTGHNPVGLGVGTGGFLNGPGGYTWFCTGVAELASDVACSGSRDVAFPTAAGECTPFEVAGIGYGRVRAGNPAGPPFVVVPTYQATASAHYALVRSGSGEAEIVPGNC